ncbi:MAG: DUF971 domain-containing protein [Ignavibacteria bacterium]|nr:DUF971 domain-containing protein [Ignavibacteria bacterium]
MLPLEIMRVDNNFLKIIWDDGFESLVELRFIRKNCPCAQCQGEEVAGKKVTLPKLTILNENAYKLKSIEIVGNYGLQFVWEDGHDTGIFSFEYLYEIARKYSD